MLHRILKTLIEEDDLLKMYVDYILKNDKIKIYNGAENVVKAAVRKQP